MSNTTKVQDPTLHLLKMKHDPAYAKANADNACLQNIDMTTHLLRMEFDKSYREANSGAATTQSLAADNAKAKQQLFNEIMFAAPTDEATSLEDDIAQAQTVIARREAEKAKDTDVQKAVYSSTWPGDITKDDPEILQALASTLASMDVVKNGDRVRYFMEAMKGQI